MRTTHPGEHLASLVHRLECGSFDEAPAPPPAEQAICVNCGERRPVCCAARFVQAGFETTFVNPVCVGCCTHATVGGRS